MCGVFLLVKKFSTINSVPYKRYFQVFDVTRDASGNIGTGNNDPSTQKIIVYLIMVIIMLVLLL